jgi:hypothetical protein
MHSPLTAARQRCRAAAACLVVALLAVLVPVGPAALPVGAAQAAAPTPAPLPEQFWITLLSADLVWERHTRGEGVVVAVLDPGVDPSGDLQGAVQKGFTADGSGRGDVDDSEEFHGTGMATKIAGRGTGPGIVGMAPGATILPVKLPTLNQDDGTAAALRTLAAMDDPPEVVNMSYNAPGECTTDQQAAVREAIDAGMILVAAAGNNEGGPEIGSTPASCAGVVVVGAFGSYGTDDSGTPVLRMYEGSETHDYVSLAAPGVNIISFNPGSSTPVYHDGTSDATAIASGAFALVRAANPDMSSRELVARVLATARPLDDRTGTRSQAWGFGVVRPLQAIEERVPASAANPIYDELDQVAPPTDGPTGGPGQTDGSTPDDGTAPTPDGGTDTQSGATADENSSLGVVAVLGGMALVVVVLAIVLAVALSRRRRTPAGPR